MSRPGIHFFLDGFGANGGNRILSSITRELCRQGVRVTVYVPDTSDRPFFALGESAEVIRMGTLASGSLAKALSLLSLSKACAQVEGVVVVMRQRVIPFALAGLSIGKALGRRSRLVMLVQHLSPLRLFETEGAASMSDLAMQFVARGGYKLPIEYVAVSEWLARQANLRNHQIVSNGVDLTAFYPVEGSFLRDTIVIGSIARRSVLKGFDIFTEAIDRLSCEFKTKIHVKLVAGNAQDRNWIQEFMPDKLSWELVICRNDAELRAFYNQTNIFVFSSRNEGFGLPPLEAMACGTAVVTTDCGGVRDYADGSNCIIVEPEAEALVQGVSTLVLDEDLRKRLEVAGLETARSRSLAKQAMKHAAILTDLLEQKSD
jgi:glycosyltransferase involved in cell wall biosynthesis